MTSTLIERLPHLLSNGRRNAQRLIDAVSGRYRERAVLQEIVCASRDNGLDPHARRLLQGDPTLCLAAILAEQDAGIPAEIHTAYLDLSDCRPGENVDTRIAEWIPRVLLLRAIAPDCTLRVRLANEDAPALRLVLDALLEPAEFRGTSRGWMHYATSHLPSTEGATLLVVNDVDRFLPLAQPRGRWIACAATTSGFGERLRGGLLQRGDTSFAIDAVGAAAGEWARRNAGGNPVAAMHAALAAFGATPIVQTSAGTTPGGRRRAGMEVLLGECVRNGLRTLVWVDAPDRRTGDATLCRAITRREAGAPPWGQVVLLGWQFVPTFAQHMAARCDSRVEALAIHLLPRIRGTPAAARVDPDGFRPVGGLASAWIDRRRSETARNHEWLTVQLREANAITDWSIDPNHDGEVFRGAWHAARDAQPGVRSVRLRVPWREGPRRVCIRANDDAGRVSEYVCVVRHRAEAGHPTHATSLPAPTRTEALC